MSGLCKECGCDADGLIASFDEKDKRIAELEKLLADCDPQWQHAVSENMRLEAENERLEAAIQYALINSSHIAIKWPSVSRVLQETMQEVVK